MRFKVVKGKFIIYLTYCFSQKERMQDTKKHQVAVLDNLRHFLMMEENALDVEEANECYIY